MFVKIIYITIPIPFSQLFKCRLLLTWWVKNEILPMWGFLVKPL